MAEPGPFFTVIIPTHRRARLLGRALHSVKSQHCPAGLEVIVVSDTVDADTDAVCAQLLGPEDCYLRRSGDPGPSASRNWGLELAKGQYVLFLDDDDAWQPQWLNTLSQSELALAHLPVYADCTVVSERRLASGPQLLEASPLSYAGMLNDGLYVKNQVHMSCYALPRWLIGPTRFDTVMRAYEDWDFLLALYRKQPARHLAAPASFVFEVHDETSDRRGAAPEASGMEALLDYLYVYRRHPAPHAAIQAKRAALMAQHGLGIPIKHL
jgi:GalNAc5-diNAcBac-PP-undecaprenol beta-1,3-glucosyltransferase